MATGRTVGKFTKLQIDDANSAGTLRDIPVATFADVGFKSGDVIDLTALQDAVQGFFTGVQMYEIPITGPFDTTTKVSASGTGAAPALSGSHLVLKEINNGSSPLAFGVYIGMQGNWATNDPVFGITGTAANGCLLRDYTVDINTMMYSAIIYGFPGSAAPTWGTAQLT
ncbi:hypothetical protein LCGC14_2100320 [marine sediment metagenome]|uniref:Phage tail protein n=1 Tax=marine sediment metagenome TaxID=412755 RepID=A0A0F9GN94_9ZZZZ